MIQSLMIFIGWLGLIPGTLLWVSRGIYQLVTTEYGFFFIFFSNLGWWVLHMIGCFILLGFGYIWLATPKKKKDGY